MPSTRRKTQQDLEAKTLKRKPHKTADTIICRQEADDRKKRKSTGTTTCVICPVCTVTVRGDEKFHQHYIQELEKAKEPFVGVDIKKKQYMTRLQWQRQQSNDESDTEIEEPAKCLEDRTKDLNNVRKRRYERYANMFLMSMKRNQARNNNNNQTTHSTSSSQNTIAESSSVYEVVSCAVCNEFLETSNSNRHLSKCFAKHDYQFEVFSSSDEEPDDEEEDVDLGENWMDNAHFRREGNLTRLVMEDDDGDLDIDGDEENAQFGKQQFTENDVIVPVTTEGSDEELLSAVILRDAVSNGACSSKSEKESLTTNKQESDKENSEINVNQNVEKQVRNILTQAGNDSNKLVGLLSKYINKTEEKLEKDISKCPICMGPYVNPAVSISCWHTCCSECWLRVLGSKKLCPKCNDIVAPSQLRKIYL